MNGRIVSFDEIQRVAVHFFNGGILIVSTLRFFKKDATLYLFKISRVTF